MVEVFKSTLIRRMTTGGNYVNLTADVVLLSDYETLRAELEQVKRERDNAQKLADSNYANICTQHRQIEDLTTRAEAAERLAGARVKDVFMAFRNHFAAPGPYQMTVGAWNIVESSVRRILSALAEPAGEPITLTYRNWRGETAKRTITPNRIWFGSTDWHPEPQWLLTAFDHDKQAVRDFALKDFGAEPAGEAEPRQFLLTEDGEFNGNADEAPIAAEDEREVDWIDVTGWGVFKGHAIPVDVARYIATKINLYAEHRTTPPDASVIREALEKVDAELADHGYAEIGTLRATIRTAAALAGAKP